MFSNFPPLIFFLISRQKISHLRWKRLFREILSVDTHSDASLPPSAISKEIQSFLENPIFFFQNKPKFWTFWEILLFQSQSTSNLLQFAGKKFAWERERSSWTQLANLQQKHGHFEWLTLVHFLENMAQKTFQFPRLFYPLFLVRPCFGTWETRSKRNDYLSGQKWFCQIPLWVSLIPSPTVWSFSLIPYVKHSNGALHLVKSVQTIFKAIFSRRCGSLQRAAFFDGTEVFCTKRCLSFPSKRVFFLAPCTARTITVHTQMPLIRRKWFSEYQCVSILQKAWCVQRMLFRIARVVEPFLIWSTVPVQFMIL